MIDIQPGQPGFFLRLLCIFFSAIFYKIFIIYMLYLGRLITLYTPDGKRAVSIPHAPERTAARQNFERKSLTVSGLVTANTYQSCYAMAYIMRVYPYSFRVYGCKHLSCKFVPRLCMSAAYMAACMCWICARAIMLFIRWAAPAGVVCLFKFLIKRLAP